MPSYLGSRTLTGVTTAANPRGAGFWTVAFDSASLNIFNDFEVYHIAISGPTGSNFQVFIDNVFYDFVARGDINSWDPSQVMDVRSGQVVYFYWNTGATPAPVVSVFCRQPYLV